MTMPITVMIAIALPFAVKLAAPFSLPEDLYAGWKVVTTNFDRRLSQ